MSRADKAWAKAIRALEAATPASGFRPTTEAEWEKLVTANEKMAYATYLQAGASKEKARALARITMGGAAGRLLLEMSFDAEEARHG